jgi:hypothetical protein
MALSKSLPVVIWSVLMTQPFVFADVTVERSERGAVVKIDGELFTEYLTKAGQSPAMWPVIGPTGHPMTRAYPVGPPQKGETPDHPHHQSLWFTHDQVNGVDFWKANVSAGSREQGAGSQNSGLPASRSPLPAPSGPHIAHREFSTIESLGSTARIVTRNDWMDGQRRICEDRRTAVFGTRASGDRWIDFTITLKASDGEVTFGDTKEGTFALRVADSIRTEANLGGRIVNSEGQTNDEAWGMPARWVDYTGPVGKVSGVRSQVSESDTRHPTPDTRHLASDTPSVVGIAIMSHPTSFRPVPRWHVRGYGLFAANPFGERDFPKSDAAKQGAVTIPHGESLALRYRVLLHRGRTEEANIEAAFEEFARTPAS